MIWDMVKLGDVATFVNGYAFKPSDWGKVGLPIIRIQNITKKNKPEENYYNGEYNPRYEINNGDILISWSATLGVYEWNEGKALLNQHIFKVVFDKAKVCKAFFKFAVSNILSDMNDQIHGSTMKHITKKDFDNLKILIPPLAIQQKISNALDSVTALINKRKEQIELMDQLAKDTFIEMFGDPVTNPKGWKPIKLKDIGNVNRGVSKHRPRNAPDLLGGVYPLIQTGDVSNSPLYITSYSQTYSEIGLKQSKMWKAGTLCITIAANIAKTAILKFDACFPDSVVAFNSFDCSNNIFVHYWFSFFQKILESSAPASAQKNINLKILNDLDVFLPPIELQNQFEDRIAIINKQKEIFQNSLIELETIFKATMQRAFNGELFI